MANFAMSRCLRWAAAAVWLSITLMAATAGGAIAADGQTPIDGAPAMQQAPETPASTLPIAAAPSPAAAASKPSFLHQLRRWWEQFAAGVSTKMEDARKALDELHSRQNDAARSVGSAAQETMRNAAEATKNTATAIVRLPNARVIEMHERCATAANGAPDCRGAALNACRGKGFAFGQPLDVRSADRCATTMWLSEKGASGDDCLSLSETVVTRALCQ